MSTTQTMASYTDRLIEDGVAIFLLHGVEDGVKTEVRNYTRKHIPREEFQQLLQALKNAGGNPVSMDDIVANRVDARPLPPFAFAITFDDGFENNLSVAAPILVEEKVPGMFYVTSDFIDRNRMSWIDRVEYVVETASKGKLELPWGEEEFFDVDSKVDFLNQVRKQVKSNEALDADEVATKIQNHLIGREIWSSEHPLDQKMNWSQVRELADTPGCSVGGHTHSHPIMSFLDPEDLRLEVSTCLGLLHLEADLDTRHFSYPEGLEHCYNDSVIEVLKQHDIVCSPSAIDGVNREEVDLFNLRRIFVV